MEVAVIANTSYERFVRQMVGRIEWRGVHRGLSFSVITGWDINSDRWPIHLVVDGHKCEGVIREPAATEEEAKAWGLAAAEAVIDRRLDNGGFQRFVAPD